VSKLVYQPRKDFLIEVSLFNLDVLLNEETFEVIISEIVHSKINKLLDSALNSNILCFPEYSYNQDLFELYRNFCDDHNIIIIGGSGIEKHNDGSFAYCPVFIPNKEMIKVYKKFLTIEERTYSKGRLIPYPNPTERHFNIELNDIEFVFTVSICYDFLQENYENRTDIIFVPQYEQSPGHFINQANNIVQGFDNFVIGVNNSGNNMRSIGFSNLNKSLIEAFGKMRIRKKEYKDADNHIMNEHHTIIYDITHEQKLTVKLNLAHPVPKPYNFSYSNYEPSVIIV
jgi:predicted amidohydrolase